VWSGYTTRHHAHPEYQLTLTVAGCGRYAYLGGEARVPAGCMAIFHPGEPHAMGNAADSATWQLRVLHIPPAWLEAERPPLLLPAPLVADPELVGAFEAVWDAFDAPRASIERAVAHLAGVLASRPGLELTSRPRSALVRRCLTELAAVLDRPLSLAALARMVDASPTQIRRAVTAATGLPPQAWHLQRRVQEAKHWLARGEAIAATALGTGFADQAHFTRHFTRLVGVSPSRYAAGVRGRDDAP
jgi:AraC-like DNA-binding protein